jgi:hypothetical protein
MKKRALFAVIISPLPVFVVGILGLLLIGCASMQPITNETMGKYGLDSNPDNFKNFQYYVSRDIVLAYNPSKTQSTTVGQSSGNRDSIQVLSSTPGVVLDVRIDENDITMLGVAFETDNNSLLWFIQNPFKPGAYFYLVYTSEAAQEIDYGGHGYVVSYERARGIGAFFKRLFAPKKTGEGKYENMEPILLYEEKTGTSEQRRNLQGRKL